MEFDKSKVYTSLTADEIKLGSKGYYADCIEDLEKRVSSEDTRFYSSIVNIEPASAIYRFKIGVAEFALFYLVEGLEENEKPEIGDSIRLPVFTVPKVTIGGYRELSFDKQTVEDTATIYNIKNGKIYLVFDHVLFQSAMDLNNAAKWKDTQLCAYLCGAFKDAMRNSGIPILKVSVLSKGKCLKNSFFREGRNRIAFAKDEISTTCYWLKSTPERGTTDKREFCAMSVYGIIYNYNSSRSDFFVRPCFVIKRIKDYNFNLPGNKDKVEIRLFNNK